MIYLGEQNKESIIKKYVEENDIKKVYIIGNELNEPLGERISLNDGITYKIFYRFLQEINDDCLIVLNEILRFKNRGDLSYNCVRRYILQTKHRIIFNYYPIIDQADDFMILYDMTQSNPFLKKSFFETVDFENISIGEIKLEIEKTDVIVEDNFVMMYNVEKESIISKIRKNPELIPKQLLRFTESIHRKYNRSFDTMLTPKPNMKIVVSQLKVDQYYYGKLLEFEKEVENVISRIQRNQCT